MHILALSYFQLVSVQFLRRLTITGGEYQISYASIPPTVYKAVTYMEMYLQGSTFHVRVRY